MAREPASIRYKNPGAMWGGNAISRKWGEMGNVALADGTGQNNHIAVFPDYTHGICAQLDLWRSSKRYRGKQFDDAIAVWSGGNHVESYIKFVLDRVSGMTHNTVMDDTFWRSPMGIGFLKAQAWHEAGKRYPAPDGDWLEAQRRVLGAVNSVDDIPSAVPPDRDTKWLQTTLNTLGAEPLLDVDGIIGPKLRQAIKDFQAKNGLDDDGLVGPATMRELLFDLAEVETKIVLPAPGAPPRRDLADSFWGRFLDLFKAKDA